MIDPRATYRLQLRGGFGFPEAVAAIPYIAALGVSHLYLSPIMAAAHGSTHGYDVVDPERIDPAIGGESGFAALVAAARAAGLGILLDIVPNHMSISGTENAWWCDVLENGAASYFAEAFDVDWEGGDDRVLLPVLGERYGRAISSGLIAVEREHDARFAIRIGDGDGAQRYPVSPRSLGPVVRAAAARHGHEELAWLGDSLAELPASREREAARRLRRHRDRGVLLRRLAAMIASDPTAARAIADELAAINADPLALDALLEGQNYRLAHWTVAGDRALTHRRFFDITSLAGVRVEDPDVFAAVHRRVLGWIADGSIDGVRVDHVDGLRDPGGYLAALRAAAGPEAWIVVEKILGREERLPAAWPVDGTTGYEHADAVAGLFVDPAGAARLVRVFESYTGVAWDPAAASRRARADVMHDALHSELARVTHRAIETCARSPACRDYTPAEIQRALAEILAGFPVYRTYLPTRTVDSPTASMTAEEPAAARADTATMSAAEPDSARDAIDRAVAAARAAAPDLDGDLLDVLARAIAFELPSAEARELAIAVQQVTGPIVAKGDEDTLAYRLVAMAARCEVGCELAALARTPAEVHARLAEGGARGLLASSTHDTKRGEDTRARMLAICEHTGAWETAVGTWRVRAERGWGDVAPDRALEYLVWQTLVGAWPISRDRIARYAEKASREACLRTSWRAQDAAYEAARDRWIDGIFADRVLCDELATFAARLAPAGARNALALTAIKLCAPGVPDFYGGAELAALTLVDPDNRGAVDFAAAARTLAALGSEPPAKTPHGKLAAIRRVLGVRATDPRMFAGDYRALAAVGPHADRVFAFARGDRLIAVVPRTAGVSEGSIALPVGRWRDLLGADRAFEGRFDLGPTGGFGILVAL